MLLFGENYNKIIIKGWDSMDLLIKGIDKNENKCKVCGKEVYSDIIIEKSLLCHYCNDKISTMTVDDLEYNFYIDRIRECLLSNCNFK